MENPILLFRLSLMSPFTVLVMLPLSQRPSMTLWKRCSKNLSMISNSNNLQETRSSMEETALEHLVVAREITSVSRDKERSELRPLLPKLLSLAKLNIMKNRTEPSFLCSSCRNMLATARKRKPRMFV